MTEDRDNDRAAAEGEQDREPDAPGDVVAGSGDPRKPVIGGRYQIHLDDELSMTGKHLVVAGQDLRSRGKIVARTLREPWRDQVEEIARFRREARMQAFMKHPNLVRVEAFLEEPEGFWMVQEHLAGGSLAGRVSLDGAMPVEDLAPVLEQAAGALAELHRQGVTHLALSPRKLLFAEDGRTVKLVDLGIACPIGSAPLQAELGNGAAPYRAPEVDAGEPAGPESDLYALGAIAFAALTGTTPRAAVEASPGAATANGIPLAAAIRAGLPAWVDDVLAHALAPDPGARDPDIRMFARRYRAGVEDELARVPSTGPTEAPPPRVYRPRGDGQWVAPMPDPRVVAAAPGAESGRDRVERRDSELRPFDGIARLLWLAAAALLAVNLLLGAILLARDGAVPPFGWPQAARPAAQQFAPGELAIVATGGALARTGPGADAPPAADLVTGEIVTISGAPVEAGGVRWLPVTVTRGGAPVEAWVEEGWLRPRE